MTKSITWQTEKRKLSDLLPWERNPRQLSKVQAEHLEESLSRFGLVDPPAINTDNVIIGGHQRRNIMGLMKEYGNGAEIDVRVPSRTLTDREVEELNIRLNKNTGSFDFDLLANNFEVDDLLDWGFEPFELGIEDVVDEGEESYSRKIEAPIYTPKGEKPRAVDLYNDNRASELIAEIEDTDIPEDEKVFLKIAAQRHTVLDFEQIAEFYAHSNVEVQALMENSALVIIDFDRAIELGFVQLSERIAAQFAKDYGTR